MKNRSIALATACLATIAGAGVAQGADKTINDVRLGVNYGVAFDEEIEIQGGPGGKDDVDADSLQVNLSYVRSFQPFQSWGAFFAGGAVAYEQVDGDGEGQLDGISFESTLLSVGIEGGYAFALPAMQELHFELALGLGYVVGTQDRDFGPSIGTGLEGFEYKLRLSALYTLTEGFQAGINIGYLIDRSLDAADDQILVGDQEVTDSGLSVGLVVGWHL